MKIPRTGMSEENCIICLMIAADRLKSLIRFGKRLTISSPGSNYFLLDQV